MLQHHITGHEQTQSIQDHLFIVFLTRFCSEFVLTETSQTSKQLKIAKKNSFLAGLF